MNVYLMKRDKARKRNFALLKYLFLGSSNCVFCTNSKKKYRNPIALHSFSEELSLKLGNLPLSCLQQKNFFSFLEFLILKARKVSELFFSFLSIRIVGSFSAFGRNTK